MKLLKYIFIVLFFSSCNNKEESKYPRLISSDVKTPIEVNSKEMLNVYSFMPLAFNFKEDIKIKEYRNRYDSVRFRIIPFDSILPKVNLKIIIDTSYSISNSGFEYNFLPKPKNVIQDGLLNGKIPTEFDRMNSMRILNKYFQQKSKLTESKVKCYPLLIYNNSNSDVSLNSEFIQEAKDVDGKWKPIEFSFEYEMCGTGKNNQSILDPKKYVAFAIIKYNGDFKTKIRVKVKNNNHIYYSNEIVGIINRSQFNQGFCKSFFESYGSNVNMSYFEDYKKRMFLKN